MDCDPCYTYFETDTYYMYNLFPHSNTYLEIYEFYILYLMADDAMEWTEHSALDLNRSRLLDTAACICSVSTNGSVWSFFFLMIIFLADHI